MRLIDADAFIEELEADAEHIESSIARMMHYAIIKDIEHAPTIDAVEVVRCKDCKHWDNEDDAQRCSYTNNGLHWAKPDDFCSYGERRQK